MQHIFCTAFVLLLYAGVAHAAETPAMIEVKLGNSDGTATVGATCNNEFLITKTNGRLRNWTFRLTEPQS